MKYAVILRFDEVTELKFLRLMDSIVMSGVNDYMLVNKVPPHVTVAAIESENLNQLTNIIEDISPNLMSGNLVWCSIGVFNPNVLFLAPVLNEYLIQACALVNKSLFKEDIKRTSNYLPYQWVPHTTLATNLTDQEINNAFLTVQKEFRPFSGKTTKVLLVQSIPFKIIKEWDLS